MSENTCYGKLKQATPTQREMTMLISRKMMLAVGALLVMNGAAQAQQISAIAAPAGGYITHYQERMAIDPNWQARAARAQATGINDPDICKPDSPGGWKPYAWNSGTDPKNPYYFLPCPQGLEIAEPYDPRVHVPESWRDFAPPEVVQARDAELARLRQVAQAGPIATPAKKPWCDNPSAPGATRDNNPTCRVWVYSSPRMGGIPGVGCSYKKPTD